MKRHNHMVVLIIFFSVFTIVNLLHFGLADAQTRTPWQMHYGEGIVEFSSPAPYHGWEGEYNYASIPSQYDLGWGPAPDPDIINYSQVPSTLCGVMGCRYGADFTYFQTFVNVPTNVTVTEFTIEFTGIDDGARVTIFNSDFPGGQVVPGSYVFLGGSGIADVTSLVKSGEINRVVVTQTDDCCYHSYLLSAQVVLNGEVVEVPLEVDIDIKPGSDPNCFNNDGHGVIPVAVLGTADFDVTQIDPSTCSLEGLALKVAGKSNNFMAHIEDVNYDGFDDLVLQIEDENDAFQEGATTAILTGNLYDEYGGTPIEGTDTICLVP